MILNGADVDAEDVRRVLLDGKPSVAAAIFPLTRYSGTLTGDLFAEAETTYFDDREEFLTLQKQAVEELAEEHRKTAEWVEVLSLPYRSEEHTSELHSLMRTSDALFALQ